jgi:hypothetical protein
MVNKIRFLFGIATGLALLYSLTGCNNVFEQRHLAEQGVSKLRGAWNRSEFAAIYDESDGDFRQNEPRDKWMGQCAELRKQLGFWQTFQVRNGVTWPFGRVGIVWVEGTAGFEAGQHTVRVDFKLRDQTAQLFNLQFNLDGKLLQIPGYYGRRVD